MIQSAEEFVQLRTSSDPALYHRAAHDPAPEHVWLETIERYPEMKEWVIHNKTVPHSVLRLLADDADARVRMAVAMKRKAGPELLAKLATDPDYLVRQAVAWNAKTPPDILERLMNDPEPTIADRARVRLQGPSRVTR